MTKTTLPTLLLLGAAALCLWPGCSTAQPPTQQYDQMAIQSSRHWLDIDYVGDGHIGHRLDIHLPVVERERYPVVICIYGSAFFSDNSKAAAFQTGLGQSLLENGFALVSINHRSSREAIFPAQIQDVKAAIRFVRANADAFALDTSFVGITGWSSGGHLAAMAGTTSDVRTYTLNGRRVDLEGALGRFTDQSSAVDAVVDWFGPTDFLIMDDCGSAMGHNAADSPESILVGGAIQAHPDACWLANPASYVSNADPPFLIFHGDEDPLVPHCQSERLHQALQGAGASSEFHLVEGGKHGPGVMIPAYYARMVGFFLGERNR
ncbi:MAG: alpha/beta hydrolase [Lewinella sp.]|nr:alpha/beta hydrolase [Lewinella sp.]